MNRYISVLAIMCACSVSEHIDEAESSVVATHACDSLQQYGNGSHTGPNACIPIQDMHVQAVVTEDPASGAENDAFGGLFVHYNTPITRGDFVYTMSKRGFSDVDHVGTQTWSVQALRWVGRSLVQVWKTDSKWKPYTAINANGNTSGIEENFQPAIVTTGAFTGLVMPSEFGQLVRLDPNTGAEIGTINPLYGTEFDGNSLAIVNSAITVSDDGTIAYTVVAWQPRGPLNTLPQGSWLVLARPTGEITITPFSSFEGGAIPRVGQACLLPFSLDGQPHTSFPPTPTATPSSVPCVGMEPIINSAPAFGPNGDVVVVAGDSGQIWNEYVIDVDVGTRAVRWSTVVTNYALDGCGVDVPFNMGRLCPTGTTFGIDPLFNTPTRAVRTNILSSSPVVAPDGKVFLGVYNNEGFDNFDGSLVEIDSTGKVLGSKRGGFNISPAIRKLSQTASDYELVVADNRFDNAGIGPGLIQRVSRVDPNGMVTKVSFVHPNDPNKFANDYLDEQAAIDTQGNGYHLSAAGRVDKVSPAGVLLGSVDLGISIEPLENPLTWGTDGFGSPVLYVSYAGFMYAIGTARMQGPLPVLSSANRMLETVKKFRGTSN